MDPRGSDPRDQNLSDRRVSAVRAALIQAGEPSSRIQTGALGDTRLARDHRVEVLFITSRATRLIDAVGAESASTD